MLPVSLLSPRGGLWMTVDDCGGLWMTVEDCGGFGEISSIRNL